MSAAEQTAAERIAECLGFAVRRLRELDGLRITQHVSVDWSGPMTPDNLALHVHGCEPSELDTYRAFFPGCLQHTDADGILQWLEVDLEGVQTTFYRR